jgi:hypothetical protein
LKQPYVGEYDPNAKLQKMRFSAIFPSLHPRRR